jgi:O-antigen ligase
MNLLMAILIAAAYLTPLSIPIGDFSGFPIELVPSDLLILYLFAQLVKGQRVNRSVMLWWYLMLYFPAIAFMSYFQGRTGLGTLASAINFWLPALHLPIGYLVYQNYGSRIFSVAGFYLIGLIFVIGFSDVIFGPFPRGCGYQGRWGGCIGNFEIYGFPNASMNFLVSLSTLIFYLFTISKNSTIRFICIFSIILLFNISAMSLSKSTLISISILITLVFFALRPFIFSFIILPFSALLFIFFYQEILSLPIFTGVSNRVEVSLDNGDISTGRISLWLDTLDVIYQRPLFGHQFDLLTNYGFSGTTHQQYLEILFKSGIIGLLIYLSIFVQSYMNYFKNRPNFKQYDNHIKFFGLFGILVFFNNFTQSFTTYSSMGNICYCLAGMALGMQVKPFNNLPAPQNSYSNHGKRAQL